MAKTKRSAKEFGIYKVVLRPDADSSEFEKFMESEVLKNTITFRDGSSSNDELYARRGGGDQGQSYIWIISRTAGIDGTFTSNSDAGAAFKELKGKVESFGEVTPL